MTQFRTENRFTLFLELLYCANGLLPSSGKVNPM